MTSSICKILPHFSLLLLFFLFWGCVNAPPEAPLYGRWADIENSTHQIEFTPDNQFCIYNNGEPFVVSGFEELKYFIEPAGDFFDIYVWNKEQSQMFGKFRGMILRERLLLISYKFFIDLDDNIDEISVFKKPAKEANQSKNNPQNCPDDYFLQPKFQLPRSFLGAIYIAYGQSSGIESDFDDFGNPFLVIPSTGLLMVQNDEDPISMGFKTFSFFYPEGDDINIIPTQAVRCLISELDTTKFHLDSVYVWPRGFNQIGRDKINNIFGMEITGNVAMFQVDTLRNIREKLVCPN